MKGDSVIRYHVFVPKLGKHTLILVHFQTVCLIFSGFPLLSGFFVAWIPESPVWLAKRGRVEQAEKAMKWLKRDDDIDKLPKVLKIYKNGPFSEFENIFLFEMTI